MKIPR
jgi:hypothetical protein